MGEGGGLYRILVGKPDERRPWEDPGINGKKILKRIFRKWNVRLWTGLTWLRIGTVDVHL
jgi:hypothetical protein